MKYKVELEVVFEEMPDNEGIMVLAGLEALKGTCRHFSGDIKKLFLTPRVDEPTNQKEEQ